MRTRPTGAVAALIAVASLVAVAGPANTQAPGAVQSFGPGAFTPLMLARRVDTTATTPTLDPAFSADGTLGDDAPLRDPGMPPVPDGPGPVSVPAPQAGVLVKPTPTPRPTPRPTAAPAARQGGGGAATSADDGSWRRAEASWYGPGFYGSGTACGQTYTRTILGVAHRSLPCGTRVTFRNPRNGRTITVRVIDRGPYVSGRMWDLSRGTCSYLDNCYTGTIQYRFP